MIIYKNFTSNNNLLKINNSKY